MGAQVGQGLQGRLFTPPLSSIGLDALAVVVPGVPSPHYQQQIYDPAAPDMLQAGGFRGLSAGEASGAPGSGRDGAAPGDVFQGKIVVTVPSRG